MCFDPRKNGAVDPVLDPASQAACPASYKVDQYRSC
jgi:hypothetical protein